MLLTFLVTIIYPSMLPDAADVIHHHIVPTNTPGEQSYECSCSFKRSVTILYADVLGAENGRPDPSFSKPVSRYIISVSGKEPCVIQAQLLGDVSTEVLCANLSLRQ